MPQGFWPGQEPKQEKKKKEEAYTTLLTTAEKHDKAYHSAAEHSFSREADVAVAILIRFIVEYGIVRRRVDLFEGLSHRADIRRQRGKAAG